MTRLKVNWSAEGQDGQRILENGHVLRKILGFYVDCGTLKIDKTKYNIFFTAVEVEEGLLTFYIWDHSIKFRVTSLTQCHLEVYKLKPMVLSPAIESRLQSAENNCWVHIFSLKNDEHKVSLSSLWSNMALEIPYYIENCDSQRFRFLRPDGDLSPELQLKELFSEKYLDNSSISFILYVYEDDCAIIKFEDRFFTSEGLPTICKASLKEALNCDPSLSDSSTRRIALAGLNGGLPLEFINVIGWNPCNFQRVELNLANFVSVSVEDAKRAFQLSRISFEEKILLPKVKPKFAQGSGLKVKFEWHPQELNIFSDYRKVDVAIMTQLRNKKPVPLMLVESGCEEAPVGTYHKDHGKILCLLSMNCRILAHQLLSLGKDPELAVVVGLLVGGTSVQIHVASSQVRYVNGVKEIHVNINHLPHWHIDLLKGYSCVPDCIDSCCRAAGDSLFSFLQATAQFTPTTVLGFGPKVIRAIPDKPEKLPMPHQNTTKPVVHDSALRALYFLFKGIIDWSNTLHYAHSHSPPPPDSFQRLDLSSSVVSRATGGTNVQTPPKRRAKNLNFYRIKPSMLVPRKAVITRPLNLSEVDLCQRLSIQAPSSFPRVLDVVIDSENSKAVFHVELMYSMSNSEGDGLNGLLFTHARKDGKVAFLLDAFEVFLGTSVSLFKLHTQFKIVHSNLTPFDIFYSWVDDCWKIEHFECSQGIEESLKTPRQTGIEGWVAPEAVKNSIFTPQCDIFSLGESLLWAFDDYLRHFEYEIPEHSKLVELWLALAKMMVREDPAERPSLLLCIKVSLFAVLWFEPIGIEAVVRDAKEILTKDDLTTPIKSIDECLALVKREPHTEFKRIKISSA